MERREFIFKSGLMLTAWFSPSFTSDFRNKMNRIGMSTVLFRYRFEQTKPEEVDRIENELTLPDIPGFFKRRYGLTNIEFWSLHFESLERPYLEELKSSIDAAGSKLIDIQYDGPPEYDLASKDEDVRLESLEHVKEWMDAAAFLGSASIRVNPGSEDGSVEKSIQSMKEVNEYAKRKRLILLTENHFGLEMDPKIHLKILKQAGPENIYTLPDFGNYQEETRFEYLEEILPHAYLISAKVAEFTEDYEHISFDFDKCVRMAENTGFKGIYSVEQWSPWESSYSDLNFEKIGDWLIEHVKKNI